MKVVPLLQILHQNSGQVNSPKPNSLNFSRFLEQSHIMPQATIEKNNISEENLNPYENLFTELSAFIEEHSLGQEEITQINMLEVHNTDASFSISDVINSKLAASTTINEVIENNEQSNTLVGVLTIVTAIERLSTDETINLTPFLSKINSLLENEYMSYSSQDNKLSNMIDALGKLSTDESQLVEGQILLTKWALADKSSTIINADKLITANNNLQEVKAGLLTKNHVKDNIVKKLFNDSSQNQLDNKMKSIFTEMDITKVQSIFQQTVQSLYDEEMKDESLIEFDSQQQSMSVGLTVSSLINELSTEGEMETKLFSNENLISINSSDHEKPFQSDVLQGIFQKSALNELMKDAEIKLPSLENVKNSKELQKTTTETDVGNYDFYEQFLTEIIILNKEQVGKNTELVSLPDNSLSMINEKDPKIDNINIMKDINLLTIIIDELPKEKTTLVRSILNFAKLVGQVAEEQSGDVKEVLDKLEKMIFSNNNLTVGNHQDSLENQINLKSNSTTSPIEIINGVQALAKGIYLAASNGHSNKVDLFVKMEDMIKNQLLEVRIEEPKTLLIEKSKIEGLIKNQLIDNSYSVGNKSTLIENLPVLYEKLVNIFSKDNSLKLPSEKNTKLSEETLFINHNDQKDNKWASLNSLTSPRPLEEELVKLNRLSEDRKQSNFVEEKFTMQLDRFVSNQQTTSNDHQKTEANLRQEFTNQLINAFKNSRFGQTPNGANRLVLKLNPEHLGSLTVKLVQKNGEMIARILTSTKSAKELLDHSVHQLKQALPSLQIEIERFELTTGEQAKPLKDHSEQNQKNEKEQQKPELEEQQESEKSFIDNLKELLNKTV
ncbi:flagellar hook-length control protein FliK [Metabacillus litoralis]|uniref:flagellar hook-length control protein FliK n=1 Tax=Metabacillus litoralis TaxID=152268 RepID=UPI001CFF434E|nr:flagellar hook-length control protein FliK [Metabacillus litoralis]